MRKLFLLLVFSVVLVSMTPQDKKKCSTSLAVIFERNDGSFYMKFNDGNTTDISSSQANFICNKE